ncbi:hypothetical protein CCS05_04925 [Levilactobacillus brevis]|uniref:type II toxin-antitoxin system PemK/MazF family toxin n=1 Tax=Levilactobacillus brevis TaxID=1580 RepID=UPI000A113D69|nr:type II toxin-antitoxin system PemK/MazF family toxin [Levilactobacillus brevis]AWP46301.1 hypothetical protein CCS05_04925 [Levilactobacillus brevis]MCT3566530.1 type II toxin-antitoxin system PemK/MazF family toxin [Levilactobacillus brevis]ORJ54215.1 hypothetical protein LBR_09840 [Levilactobacillus brevis]
MDDVSYKKDKLDIWNAQKKEIAEFALTDDSLKDLHFRQGSIVWAILGENVGFEMNKERPVLILSKERFNRGTATIVPLTTHGRLNKQLLPTQFAIYKSSIHELKEQDSKRIAEKSLIKVEQIRTVSAARIGNKIGYVSPELFNCIKLRIKILFDLKN